MSSLVPSRGLVTQSTLSRLGATVSEISIPICTFTTLIGASFTTTTLATTSVSVTTMNATTVNASTSAGVTSGVISGAVTTASAVVSGVMTSPAIVSTGTTTITNLTAGTLNVQGTVTGSIIVTTKGDIITHNGTDAIRLPVGADGRILYTNPATASGLEWQVAGTSTQATSSVRGTVYGLLDTVNNNYSAGQGALSGITSGTNNTALGRNAGSTITTGTNNICIGDSSNVSAAGATNRIAFGTGASATVNNGLAFPAGMQRIIAPGLTSSTTLGTLGTFSSQLLTRATSTLTTKGDLLTSTGAALTRRAVGTDNYGLIGSSGDATGLNWRHVDSLFSTSYRYAFRTGSAQSIPNATHTAIVWDTFTTSSGGSNLVTDFTGLHFLECEVQWAPNSTGLRYVQIVIGSTVTFGSLSYPGNGANNVSHGVACLYYIPSGTTISVTVFQGSGGSLNIIQRDVDGGGYQRDRSWVGWAYIGP